MTKQSVPLEKKNGSGINAAPPTPRVFWAVLFDRMTHWRAVRSIIRVSMICGSLNYTNLSVDQKRTDITRDELIAEFRKMATAPDDVLVMLDNDHEFQPDIVGWLAASQFDVIGALAFRRGAPYDPIMFLRCGDGKLHPIAQWEPGSIVQCDMVGHGAIAIKRRVFDVLEEKGFTAPFYRYIYPAESITARPSEDMYFGSCCEQAGIGTFCDTRLIIPHLIDDAIDERRWSQWLEDHPGNVINSLDYTGQMPQLKVSIVIPTHGRAEQAVKCINQLFETVKGHEVEVIVCSDDTMIEDDRIKMVVTEGKAIEGWNKGLTQATGDAIVLAADDLWFTPGWLDAALKGLLGLPEHSGLVGFNDGATKGKNFATHYLMTRDYIERFNGGVLACPAYQHNFIDVEASARAQLAGRYHYAEDAIVEHRHYLWGKADKDETYQLTEGTFLPDQETFRQRAAAGFPDDFEPVLLSREGV